MTKCQAFTKFVKKMRKSEKKARKEKYKIHEKRKLGSQLEKLLFRCPIKKCTKIVNSVDKIVKHVEFEHTPQGESKFGLFVKILTSNF